MSKKNFVICALVILVGLLTNSFVSVRTTAQQEQTAIVGADREFVGGRILVRFRAKVATDHARQVIAALGTRDVSELPSLGIHIVSLPFAASEAEMVRIFELQPEVEFAELDRLLPVQQMLPNDPLYDNPNSWSLPRIDAPDAWSMSTGSSDVVIAILDTGVDATHPDLAGQIVPGWNIYNNNSDTRDIYGHGTAVAGTAAAASNNGIGVASVAWGCRISPVRISDNSGLASYSNIASGLTWAADHGAQVANISYDVSGSRTVSSAAKYFQSKGGVVAAAAGNQGTFCSSSEDPYILTVGATDSSDNLFSWSNYGNNLDLVAPGNVYTTLLGGLYGVGGGTSFASPIVAATAALVLSVNPSLTPTQVQDLIKQGADDLGAPGWDPIYGSGRVNVQRAVSLAVASANNTDVTPPVIMITAPVDGSTVSGSVTVTVNATDNVSVTKVALYVDRMLYASSTNAPFTIKWNTRKVASGIHSLQSTAYDGAGNTGLSQLVTVSK